MSASTSNPLRRASVTCAMIALAAVGTACDTEPPPPPPTFHVQTDADLPDALPGDGICEATPGAGDCTLRAAIDEGNALGRADIEVTSPDIDFPAAEYPEIANHVITGTIRIDTPIAPLTGFNLHVFVTVADGATLTLSGTRTQVLSVRVLDGGRFAALNTSLGSAPTFDPVSNESSFEPALVVETGGVALLQNVMAYTGHNRSDSVVIDNAGTLMIDQSTIGWFLAWRIWEQSALSTQPGGTTYMRGTWVAGSGCIGDPPVSMGYNAQIRNIVGSGETAAPCGFSEPTDQQITDFDPYVDPQWSYLLHPRGGLVDAIPVGEGICGVVDLDNEGHERPSDGDGDGVAACDIGAMELPPL